MSKLTLKSPYARRVQRAAEQPRAITTLSADEAGSPAPSGDLQTQALDRLLGTLVTVYLVSGIRLTGTLQQHDSFTLRLQGADEVLVFKHMISTVVPGAPSVTIRTERRL